MSQEEIKKIVCGACSDHCLAHARVKDGVILEQFFNKTRDSQGQKRRRTVVTACGRARAAAEVIDHPRRLNYPLKRAGARGENKWQQVTWEEALDDIASKLKQVKDQYGAESVGFCTVGENNCFEEYERRFMNLFGSPTFICHGQICSMACVMIGMTITGGLDYFGLGFTNETKCIILSGVNPVTSHVLGGYTIRDLKNNGTKLVVIDPRFTSLADIADMHLQIQPCTDTALYLGMMNVIIKEGLYDREFVDKYCYGFDKLAQRVEEYPPERVAQITGISVDDIRKVSRLYATNKPALLWHGMGIEQIPNATQSILTRYLLTCITGNLDIPGGHMLPMPHPGVVLTSEIEMANALPPEQKAKLIGHEKYPLFSSWEVFHEIEKNVMKVRTRPLAAYWIAGQTHTPSVWRTMLNDKPYPIKAVIVEGTNPLLTLPNARLVYDAFKKVDFHVNMDIWMTPTALLADYVLPAACYLEKPMITCPDYFSFFHVGEAAISPMYERKPEYYLWSELGKRLGQEAYWPWKTLDEALDYRVAPLGMNFKQAVEKGSFFGPIEFKKYEKVGFGTPTGKVELYNTTMEKLGLDPLPKWVEWSRGPNSALAKEYPMALISSRNKIYYQSQNRQVNSIRKRSPDPLAQLNPAQAEELGIADGDWIWIETELGRVKFKCEYFTGILPNLVSAEFGWWFPEDPAPEPSLHGAWKSNLNAILPDGPDSCDPATGAWVLKGARCKVYKATD